MTEVDCISKANLCRQSSHEFTLMIIPHASDLIPSPIFPPQWLIQQKLLHCCLLPQTLLDRTER